MGLSVISKPFRSREVPHNKTYKRNRKLKKNATDECFPRERIYAESLETFSEEDFRYPGVAQILRTLPEDISQWTPEDVRNILRTDDCLWIYGSNIVTHDITGDKLITLNSSDIGILSPDHRKRFSSLMKYIRRNVIIM